MTLCVVVHEKVGGSCSVGYLFEAYRWPVERRGVNRLCCDGSPSRGVA
jgi:hypothetical protein